MSHFLRQFHIISSLKHNSDKELLPFYKSIAPILVMHPVVRQMHTKTVGRNLKLKTNSSNPNKEETKKEKPLAIILSWMLAKDSHISKFQNLYLMRGFDVLTVDMSPRDLLFPTTGSQKIATNILDYILSTDRQYSNVLVHAFSVGGYMMGEIFLKMRENMGKYGHIMDRINGVVLDSAVDFEGIHTGLPRAISRNPITVKVLEWYVSCHMALMYNVATKHYMTSSKNFHNTPLRCPALFLVSEADRVGTPLGNQMVFDNWIARGVDCKMKIWKDSKHVSHMYKYNDEYITEIDQFLSKVNLNSLSK